MKNRAALLALLCSGCYSDDIITENPNGITSGSELSLPGYGAFLNPAAIIVVAEEPDGGQDLYASVSAPSAAREHMQAVIRPKREEISGHLWSAPVQAFEEQSAGTFVEISKPEVYFRSSAGAVQRTFLSAHSALINVEVEMKGVRIGDDLTDAFESDQVRFGIEVPWFFECRAIVEALEDGSYLRAADDVFESQFCRKFKNWTPDFQ